LTFYLRKIKVKFIEICERYTEKNLIAFIGNLIDSISMSVLKMDELEFLELPDEFD